MRAIVLVCCVAVGACASTGGTPSLAAPTETVRVVTGAGPAMSMSVTPSGSAKGGVVTFPVDRVWGVLRAVYDSLGIPVTTLEASNRTIGNTGLRLKRRLGEVALSKYINCGNAQGFPSADTYEVFLTVTTSAAPEPSGGTRIATMVEGQARPITIAGEFVRCATLSTLEAKVVALTNTLLK